MLVVDGEGGLQVVVDVAQKLWYKLRWCGSFYTNLKTVMMKSATKAFEIVYRTRRSASIAERCRKVER
jgi:hypothetical protein